MRGRFSKKKLISMVIALILGLWTAYQNKNGVTTTISQSNEAVIYTNHAQCRMGCRFLSKSEVSDVINNGKVNSYKSNKEAKPCPVIAKEKVTSDGQLARVVYANCPGKTKIITVIDLDTDHPCRCK